MCENAQPAPLDATPASLSARRLEGLDGLRGIAALCVFYFHTFGTLLPAWNVAGRGYLAVDFFFMLSGYVMARTYEHRFAAGYGPRRFMVARYLKLWPFMAIGALIGAPIIAEILNDNGRALGIVAANVFLIPSFTEELAYPVNVAAWSILVELTANLIHGLILWRLPTRVLAWISLGMIPLLCWIAASFGGLAVGAEMDTIPLGMAKALPSYCIGILLWRWWRDRPNITISPALAFAAMPLLILALPVLFEQFWAYDVAFVVIACPLMMAGGLAYKGANRMLRWFGQISFPLYAINLPILLWTLGLGFSPIVGVAGALALASYLALRTNSRPAAKPSLAPA